MKALRVVSLLLVVALLLGACGPKAPPTPTPAPKPTGKVEFLNWWTAGGELEALNAVVKVFKEKYPDIEFVNNAIAGGGGSAAKAVLKTRMLGGNPPDLYQTHQGSETVDLYAKTGYLAALDDVYAEGKFADVMPKGLIDAVSWNGHPYSVQFGVHRGNTLWINKKIFDENNLKVPTTFDEWIAVCEALKAKGITPLALGDQDKWEATQLFESILMATIGGQGYNDLWTGKKKFDDPGVKLAIERFGKILNYINTDHASLSWDQAANKVFEGTCAMNVMGDWVEGFFKSKGWKPGVDFLWATTPGEPAFDMVSDGLAMAAKAANPANAKLFLLVAGSREGQDAFNPIKGSIPTRTDADLSLYDDYLKWSMQSLAKDPICNSLTHGSAAVQPFVVAAYDATNVFVTDRNVDNFQKALIQAAADNQIGQ